jgi:hypothetical protein
MPARRVPQIRCLRRWPSEFGHDPSCRNLEGACSAPGRSCSQVAAYLEHRLVVLPVLHGIGGWATARVGVPASHRRFARYTSPMVRLGASQPSSPSYAPICRSRMAPVRSQSRSHMVLRPDRPLISRPLPPSPHSVPFSHPSLVLPRPMSRTCPWHPRRSEFPHPPEPS